MQREVLTYRSTIVKHINTKSVETLYAQTFFDRFLAMTSCGVSRPLNSGIFWWDGIVTVESGDGP
jgi:hypothetical protein